MSAGGTRKAPGGSVFSEAANAFGQPFFERHRLEVGTRHTEISEGNESGARLGAVTTGPTTHYTTAFFGAAAGTRRFAGIPSHQDRTERERAAQLETAQFGRASLLPGRAPWGFGSGVHGLRTESYYYPKGNATPRRNAPGPTAKPARYSRKSPVSCRPTVNALVLLGLRFHSRDQRACYGRRVLGLVLALLMLPSCPADGPVTSPYGRRIHPLTGQRSFHAGVDVGAPKGTPIRAALGGEVVHAGRSRTWGRNVVVRTRGLRVRYAHASDILVTEGELVDAGQRLGSVGSTGRATGPHLHVQVDRRGRHVRPDFLLVKCQAARAR